MISNPYSFTFGLAAVLASTLMSASQTSAAQVYYSAGGDINHVDLATGILTNIYSGPDEGRPMMPQVNENALYWTTFYPGLVRLSGLDGSNVDTIIDQGDTTTRGIEFHQGDIYWANEPLGAIYRSDQDGNGIETVISGYFGYDDGIWDFEIYDGRIYWVGWHTNKVSSTALDGSDYRSFTPGATRAFSIEIANDRIYISDDQSYSGRIISTDLDGDNVEVLVDGPISLGMDIHEDRLYYNDSDGSEILSIALAGGTPRSEFSTPAGGNSWQLVVVPEPSCGVLMMLAAACLSLRRSRERN